MPKNLASGVGVSTATATSWSNVTPVEVTSRSACASPSTHGYGIVSVVRPRCASVVPGSAVNDQYASSTWTWAIVTGSGPSLSTVATMPSGPELDPLKRQLLDRGIPFAPHHVERTGPEQDPEQPAEQHKRERRQRPKRGAPNPTGPTTIATGLVTRCHGSPRP